MGKQKQSRTWPISTAYGVTGGRVQGGKLRDAALAEIQTCPPDSVLRIDFSAVQTLDFSAADEFVGGLVGRVIGGDLGTRRFVLTGLSDSVRESIAAVLALRKRNCLALRSDGRLDVLGPISDVHEETLQFVAARGEVAVADVAARFWKQPNMTAATNRLNTLARAGLVFRRLERGGPRGNRYAYIAIGEPASDGSSVQSKQDE